MKKFTQALKDAEKVIELKSDWAKGWGRKGAASHGQGDLGKDVYDFSMTCSK